MEKFSKDKNVYNLSGGWKVSWDEDKETGNFIIIATNAKDRNEFPDCQKIAFAVRNKFIKKVDIGNLFEFSSAIIGYIDDEKKTGTKATFEYTRKLVVQK
ncbi:TPA: hypothetical protein DEP21_02455 [Patescibacteria group bacterium]|nr:hypothetical protein [Candidatus Gracilibacteria bacterium]